MMQIATLPHSILLEPFLRSWLLEDMGRGDRTTQALFGSNVEFGEAHWSAKEAGTIAGLPIAMMVFKLLSVQTNLVPVVAEGESCNKGQVVARIESPMDALLMGERVALNLVMRLSGIATLTRKYVDKIADLPAKLVDTRKTTPGLRLLEKYAAQVGGAVNHRMGLDDAVMIKDNHIAAAGGIKSAIAKIRSQIPYPLSIEVETETLDQVAEAVEEGADIIMLDNMPLDMMEQAVKMIRAARDRIKIEASGNITLETIRPVAETGVDYISSSAPITRSTWLDLSMRINHSDAVKL
ncbi:MAG TPA: carboxylating nicotinate-nucleotide diphosphorylase [Cyanobacteria bacterium UBA11149]|nr:carboxylating nicotinate-nucleotide diphosphorylase [Cyanobacteria bacterium UBA11367]HBE58924.1 carboxylating nicotinate-nucleotide diphosphorylase [Cyanobacteria bacterium UBA11366]HBK63757.1 carboxylating nicotinate-nucleotide diphosphorylase [Cyanobacteria bacterium UBA11166]HBR75646.1 carboxylating nicotinate-nucleotide diphosphorylase [Cyanobacteria bacterium UBA11159]HBS70953.1 carboxylating nicotinate-nucleotide diphosphorylase [Cyanobacteria bacterium UBA11153]HBW87430.1 carboxylat